jgi:hypothetical protein
VPTLVRLANQQNPTPVEETVEEVTILLNSGKDWITLTREGGKAFAVPAKNVRSVRED